ncbi:galactokinase, partial [Quaeritorhiza haematococci]
MDLASQPTRIAASLSDIYEASKLDAQQLRWKNLHAKFVERFGVQPEFYARSPGRVNIIGEHIDYAGFSVLPMALDRDVVIAVAPFDQGEGKPATIQLSNAAGPDRYPDRTLVHLGLEKGVVDIDNKVLEWSNYFAGAYKAAFETLKLNSAKSFYAMIDGTVPAGAGVSSSAAFVCAAALATASANKATMTKGQLTAAGIQGEHYVGVRCGG